jgi:hypothetical protein
MRKTAKKNKITEKDVEKAVMEVRKNRSKIKNRL